MNRMRKMTNACRVLAHHIDHLKMEESVYQELKFLRDEFSSMLLDESNQEELLEDFHNFKQIN